MAKKMINADENLKKKLLPGEEICWSGKVKPFQLFEQDAKLAILGKWIGGVAVMGFTVAFFTSKGMDMKTMAFVLLMELLFVLNPLLERRNLLQYRYWITNKRAILMSQDGDCVSIDQERIDDYQIIRGRTSGDCLVLCSDIFEETPKQLRWQACHPRTQIQEGGSAGIGMVFYALEDADAAAEHLLCKKLG